MIEKRKAFAYITHRKRLLVFTHPTAPEAGIQVPAGTVKDGESPVEAVMREAYEETGLPALRLDVFLGEMRRDMSDFGVAQIHHRHFYHLTCEQNPPEMWTHGEFDLSGSVGESDPIPFDFFWVDLPDGVPELIADHGAMLPALIKHLAL